MKMVFVVGASGALLMVAVEILRIVILLLFSIIFCTIIGALGSRIGCCVVVIGLEKTEILAVINFSFGISSES